MPWWILTLLSIVGYVAGFVGTSIVLTFRTNMKQMSDIIATSIFWPVTVPVMLTIMPFVFIIDGVAWYANFLKDARWKRKIKS